MTNNIAYSKKIFIPKNIIIYIASVLFIFFPYF